MTTLPERFEAVRLAAGPARLRVGVVGGLATLACGWCLLPIVDGGWWFPRAVVVVCVIILAGAVLRLLRTPVPLLPLGSAAALVVALSALFAPEDAVLGVLPGPGAIEDLRSLLESGRADAWATVPPAAQTAGLTLMVVAGIGLVAVMVDTLGPGLDLPALTLLPLGALYSAPWLVGAHFPPTWSFVVLVLAWLAILSAHELDRLRRQVPGAAGSPALPALAAVGATLAACLVIVPLVPASGDGHRVNATIRPLGVSLEPVVALRRAVLHSTGMTVLTYETSVDEPDYLRLAVLDQFDGKQWRASTKPAEQPLRRNWTDQQSYQVRVAAIYRLNVGPLLGPVIPSPPGTMAADTDTPVAWTPEGLPVREDRSAVRDTDARIAATDLGWTPKKLAAASQRLVPAPPGYADDPQPLVGPVIGDLANQVSARATNPYEQALAIQRWFTTTGGFKYSTDVRSDSSGSALLEFLEERVGYCEQFAATMALMARSLGIPARVVVGFTQGHKEGKNGWRVLDSDAHSWPELWMGSAGWVRFEPTPRTSSVAAPGYAATEEVAEPTPQDGINAPVPSEAPASALEDTEAVAGSEESGDQGLPTGWILAGVAGLLGALAIGLAVPALVRVTRRRRRESALGRPGAAQAAYAELIDTMIDLGIGQPDLTERRTCQQVLEELSAPLAARAATTRIIAAVERERYGPPEGALLVATREYGEQALRQDLKSARGAMLAGAGRGRRLRAVLLPRSLWR